MTMPRLAIPSIDVTGTSERFPVRRIYCVGQNYAEHVREMGNDPDRQRPFFFTKPADAIVASGSTLPFPSCTQNLHHEVELVLALGSGGANVSIEDAHSLVLGCAVGVDLTRRDLQAEAKTNGRPWDMAKGFDRSAPVGTITRGAPPSRGTIALSVNGDARQSGDLAQMIWKPAEILAELSRFVDLAPGDLVFTGTPAGVGPVRPGETLHATIVGLEALHVTFAT